MIWLSHRTAAALATAIVVAACIADAPPAEVPTGPQVGGARDNVPAAVTTVVVADNSYNPAAVTVAVGDSITWTWSTGINLHTVTFSDGSRDSGDPQATGTFSTSFAAVGTFSTSAKFMVRR